MAFLLAITACVGNERHRPLTEDDSGSQVGFESFEEFEVRLASNPSTGYSWVIPADSLPVSIRLMSDGFDPGETGLVGAAGTQWFRFEAAEPGSGILRLEYLRSFDEPAIPLRVVEYVVRVGPESPASSVTLPSTATATAPP
jgi:predicted secreted protein